VTLVHRDAHLGQTIKYWVKPDIENDQAGQIQALFETQVKDITPQEVCGQQLPAAKSGSGETGFCAHR